MPVRLGHFYAFLLLLVCLCINIAFFSEVREPFLGGDDPLTPLNTALNDLNIKARVAEIYPKIKSNFFPTKGNTEQETSTEHESVAEPIPEKAEKQEEKDEESTKKQEDQPKSAKRDDPFLDFSLLPSPPSELFAQPEPKELPAEPVIPKENESLQQPVTFFLPAPQTATVQPVAAEQFKPILIPKPAEATKRPLRYD